MIILPNKYSFRLVRASHVRKESLKEEHMNAQVSVPVRDESRRAFLKTLGIVGAGFVGASVLPGRSDALIMGGTPGAGVVGVRDASNVRVNPAKEDGNLATLAGKDFATQTTLAGMRSQTDKLSFDGNNSLYVQAANNFTSQLENSSNVVINPATEDSLFAVKTQMGQFTFDGNGNLKTVGSGSGGTGGVVGVQDTASIQINPATEDSIILLRRIVKLMESQAVVDSGNRQRVTIDSLGPATAISTSIPVSGTVTATVANATLAAGTAIIGSVNLDGQGHQMFQDFAKTAYATGIRSQLSFS